MPIYEYQCQKCGKVTEIFHQRLEQTGDISCSNCGSHELIKLFSRPAAIIKGSSLPKGTTCCGQTERCDTPPCSINGVCKRD